MEKLHGNSQYGREFLPEEHYLEQRFGEKYLNYKKSPRLPRHRDGPYTFKNDSVIMPHMKSLLWLVLILGWMGGFVAADVLILKSGKSIEGEIISQTEWFVRIRPTGKSSVKEYLLEQIERILPGEKGDKLTESEDHPSVSVGEYLDDQSKKIRPEERQRIPTEVIEYPTPPKPRKETEENLLLPVKTKKQVRSLKGEGNAAVFYREALDRLLIASDFGKAMQEVIQSGWFRENSELKTYLNKNAEALDVFKQGALLKRCDFSTVTKIADRRSTETYLPDQELSWLIDAILAEGRWFEARKEFDMALTNYMSVIRFADHYSSQRPWSLAVQKSAWAALSLVYPLLKDLILLLEGPTESLQEALTTLKQLHAALAEGEHLFTTEGLAPEMVNKGRRLGALGLTQTRLLQTAVSLRLFERQQGNVPENLNVLIPEYLTELPIDPFAGSEPLRYMKTDNGWTLFSLGPDGVDHQGQMIWDDHKADLQALGDVVITFPKK